MRKCFATSAAKSCVRACINPGSCMCVTKHFSSFPNVIIHIALLMTTHTHKSIYTYLSLFLAYDSIVKYFRKLFINSGLFERIITPSHQALRTISPNYIFTPINNSLGTLHGLVYSLYII